jgi:hypothetical protein
VVTDFEERYVARDIAFLVSLGNMRARAKDGGIRSYLDHKVKMAKVIITASGGVTTHDLLPTYLCGDLYMLANRETKNISWAWKSEAISMVYSSTQWR